VYITKHNPSLTGFSSLFLFGFDILIYRGGSAVNMDTVERLQEGRWAMAERCMAVAERYTPEGVTVTYRKSLTGTAFYNENRMVAPKPVTRKALYIYLHECAHFHLRHRGWKSRYMEEFEAEQWAHEKMREAEVPIPREMTQRARDYIWDRILQAIGQGTMSIDRRAVEFTGREWLSKFGIELVKE